MAVVLDLVQPTRDHSAAARRLKDEAGGGNAIALMLAALGWRRRAERTGARPALLTTTRDLSQTAAPGTALRDSPSASPCPGPPEFRTSGPRRVEKRHPTAQGRGPKKAKGARSGTSARRLPALFGRGLRAGASYAVASGSRVGTPFAAPLKRAPRRGRAKEQRNKGNRGGFGLTARC
jgi:hypothetical protein